MYPCKHGFEFCYLPSLRDLGREVDGEKMGSIHGEDSRSMLRTCLILARAQAIAYRQTEPEMKTPELR